MWPRNPTRTTPAEGHATQGRTRRTGVPFVVISSTREQATSSVTPVIASLAKVVTGSSSSSHACGPNAATGTDVADGVVRASCSHSQRCRDVVQLRVLDVAL